MMMYKVLAIHERAPKASSLPSGLYIGQWGGYVITVRYNDKTYELTTEEGVKGIGINVVVRIKDGVVTFDTTNN